MADPLKYRLEAARVMFYVACLLPFFLLPLLSLTAGISGDEPVHHAHAEMVYNYFATNGEDRSALETPETFLRYYGQSADDLAYRVIRWTGSDNPYLVRHLLIALFAALAVLFAALAARLLAGYPAGILTVVLLLLSPPFLGHSPNNMKDIPFAMGYLMTVYSLLVFLRNLPKIKAWAVAGMIAGTAFSLSVRAGGLLLFPIILLFGTVGSWISQPEKGRDLYYLKIGSILVGIVALGWAIGILDWPYARLRPIANTVQALTRMTHYNVSLRQLFNGEMIWSDAIPWYYALKYLLITTPAVVLGGILLAAVSARLKPASQEAPGGSPRLKPASLEAPGGSPRLKPASLEAPGGSPRLKPGVSEEPGPTLLHKVRLWQWALVLFCAVFPVFWVIVQRSNLYGGIRHLLFVYPLLVLLAATGWTRLWQLTKRKMVVRASWFLFGLACAGPLVHIVRNHPVEYVYFNKISGGLDRAWGRYEADYYFHSLGPAVKWFEREILAQNGDKPVTLASSFPLEPFFLRSGNPPELVYVPFNQRGERAWDYGIFTAAYLSPSQLRPGCWPPAGTIHTIRVDGYPVCAIVKRVTDHDHQGIRAFAGGDYEMAAQLLQQAAAREPCNLSALLYLGWSYRKNGQRERSDEAARQLLSIHPESEPARELLIWNRLDTNDMQQARQWAEELFRINPKYPAARKLLNLASPAGSGGER